MIRVAGGARKRSADPLAHSPDACARRAGRAKGVARDAAPATSCSWRAGGRAAAVAQAVYQVSFPWQLLLHERLPAFQPVDAMTSLPPLRWVAAFVVVVL